VSAATARALRAEWTKLRTVPVTARALLVVVAGTWAVSTWAAIGLDPASCEAGRGCDLDTTAVTLSGVYLGQVAVVVVAALVVTAEYDTMMIRTTLAANPRRGRVLAAKAVVVTGAVLAAGLLAVTGSLLAGRLILPGHGFTPAAGYPPLSLADGPVRRAYFGSVLYLGLLALLSVGVAAIVRHTAAAVSTVLAMLLVLPAVAVLMTDPQWRHWVLKLSPMTAGLAVQATKGLDTLPVAPWSGLGILAGYAAAALVAGGVLFLTRDA
jgi:ABC-2 type transport system permease protein